MMAAYRAADDQYFAGAFDRLRTRLVATIVEAGRLPSDDEIKIWQQGQLEGLLLNDDTAVARIQASTGEAVSAIGASTARIREIDGVAASIAAAVAERGAATQEIVRDVGQAAQGTAEVTGSIVGVAESATATGTAADTMLGATADMSRRAGHLTAEVHRFLDGVRAA
ncbi:hypothetical protein ACRBEV_24175 [Methylobacterium phyllosphaerae]